MPPDSASNTESPIEAGSEAVSTPRGSVEISHGTVGLESWVIIKLPVPAFESPDEAQRRAEILARARKLIDSVCKAAAQPGDEPALKFVWLPAPIEPASREALDASLTAVEGVRWTMPMADQQTQKADKSRS